VRLLLPAFWAGLLAAVALIAAPSAFAALPAVDAGRVVARIFAIEAHASLVFGASLVLLQRRAGASFHSADLLLVLGALFCTICGYFALQPMIAAARAGRGALSFGQLHAVSLGFYAVKSVLVMALAWRATPSPRPSSSGSSADSSRA
jgi:hypothetical protein